MRRSSRKPAAIPADLWDRPQVAEMLANRDVAAIFRVLQSDLGLSQRQIGELVGMAQSEVYEILAGRRVRLIDTLERVADRLGCGRWRMNLAPQPSAATTPPPTPRPPDPPARPVVDWWTSETIRQLRSALRMSVRRFASVIGVSDRAVSLWEAGDQPKPGTQALLDEVLANAPDDAVARFARWATTGWAMHAVLPDAVNFATAVESAVKVAVVAGLDLSQVTISPVAVQSHRYPVACGKRTGAGWCAQPRGHSGDCDGG